MGWIVIDRNMWKLTAHSPTTNGPKKKSQGNLENILRWMKTYQNLRDELTQGCLEGNIKL